MGKSLYNPIFELAKAGIKNVDIDTLSDYLFNSNALLSEMEIKELSYEVEDEILRRNKLIEDDIRDSSFLN